MTKKIATIIMMIFFVCMFIGETYADRYLNFEKITTDDGLSQSTAQAMLQDSNGYIWIGTSDGLNRYNGLEMKVFKCNKLDETTLVDNDILVLKEDNNKNLWVGTFNGLSVINLKDYSIKNYPYYKKDKKKEMNKVYTILVRENGRILIGTDDGVYTYNEKNDDFDKIIDNEEIVSGHVQFIEEDNNKDIWIGTSKGLSKIDIENKKVNRCTYRELENENINVLMFDDKNNLWVGTSKNGLYKINISTNKIDSFHTGLNDQKNLPSNNIRALLQDKDGIIWVGTDKGVSKYLGDNKFATYTKSRYDLDSLSNNIFSMIQDLSGLIWIGTYTGIIKFDPQNVIELYKHSPLNSNSLSDNAIHGIYEDDEGLIWIGTINKGLNIFDRKNNKIKHIYEGSTNKELISNSINVITGSENIIWVGGSNGLNKIDKNDMSIKKITTKDGLINNNIKSLLLDSKGYLWVGTIEGLDIINPKTNEIIHMTDILRSRGIDEMHIETIYEDDNGVYWLGEMTSGSLIRINPNNDIGTKIYKVNTKNNRLSGIMCINEDNYNNLWIGTINGLYKFNKKTEKINYYSEENGLANNNVYGILFDEQGNPWMSTNNGISKLNLKTNKFATITSTDGLQNNEFNGKSYCKLKNGEFVFGGINGLNIFNPKDISLSPKSPKVTFDIFGVVGKEYNNINGKTFKNNENFIRIKFFIPEYKKNSNVQYFYQMQGLNNEWIQIKNNEVIFNGLPAGKYTFKIKARSQNGNMGELNSVSFTIKPPIWATQLAIFIYFIAAIVLIYYIANRLKVLDNLVAKRTADLSRAMEENEELYKKAIENERSKNNYFINLSHELRTPLNVISSLEQLISALNKGEKGISKDKIDYYMEVMRNNTKRLLNLINNIIDTSKIENGKYKIDKSLNDIVYLVEETALSLKDPIESDNIELIIDTDVEEKMINCDKDQIERCIVNLISNASKFTPPGGRITVEIKDKNDSVQISVEDTGIGIDEEYHKIIFDRFNQIVDEKSEEKGGSGLGLTITKQLVDLHDGDIYVISEKNKGSKFVITLPV